MEMKDVLADKAVMDEIRSKVESDEGLPKSKEWNIGNDTLRAVLADETSSSEMLETRPYTEAIILEFGRPALLIKNDTFEIPNSDIWKARLYPTKSKVEKAIKSVGRIELLDHPSYEWVGTGWMITENIIVTNRHVALEFAEKRGKSFVFSLNPGGKAIRARIDFKEEYKQNAVFETELEKVLFIEKMGGKYPDLAFLQLKKTNQLPSPISLSTSKRSNGDLVAVIGYPARDHRSDFDAMVKVFGDIYDVKRLAPGTVTSFGEDLIFTHDCSTLGGNSGSAVVDIATGDAVGLHFGGKFQKANYAVKTTALLRALTRLKIQVPVSTKVESRQIESAERTVEKAPKPEDYADRRGYRPNFLGVTSQHRVSLPTLGKRLASEAVVVNDQLVGHSRYVLDYMHFSIVMSNERKMAFYTAVNIDGNQLRRIPRVDTWQRDPRIAKTYQFGEELYANNDLDKGHLVRRLDPVWGSEPEARTANADTFHFTNSSPQHKDFNQKTWNDLEDYVLDNADVHDLKISVFTGPVYRDDDRLYRSAHLPRRFWKIVVMVKEEDQQLTATAYMLSQADLLTDIEFIFGQFKTYQVSIDYIEKITGLRFGKLKGFDPKDGEESFGFTEIGGPQDIVF